MAPALIKLGHQVASLTMRPKLGDYWENVKVYQYHPGRGSTPEIHPWLIDLETKVIRAEAIFRRALQLKAEGYRPDLIIAHPGWGESLFLKDVWPHARLAMYCEFFYHAEGADMGFDPEFAGTDEADVCRLKLKNLNNFLHFELADAGISPTHWQASTFPKSFQNLISVIHDGIDTAAITPNPNISLSFQGGVALSKADEIITFVARNLEPYRGFHIFMRALPKILKQRPKARILIIGNNDVSYGKRPTGGGSWKDVMIAEISAQVASEDWSRVHFLGNVPYPQFIALLQLSTVHIYLTYPFVLSWSLLEAMSVGCSIVASNTQPLHEAIIHNETGRLVDFFDVAGLVDEVCSLLDTPEERSILGNNARMFAQTHYDLHTVCLPKQLTWVEGLLTT